MSNVLHRPSVDDIEAAAIPAYENIPTEILTPAETNWSHSESANATLAM